MDSLIGFIAGLVVGIVAVSVAVELAWKKSVPEKTCKLLKKWSLSELKNPLIVAEKISIEPPADAKVVVATPSPKIKNAVENEEAIGNYAVGITKAYIFAGEIKENQIAFVISDEDILKELRANFYELYRKKEKPASYVPTKGKVRVRGVVKAVVPYRDGYIMRLAYEEGVLGVLLKERMDVEGRKVEVEGEISEYPFVTPYNIILLD
jgi:hypothetical protein